MSEFKSWSSYWDFEKSVRCNLRYVRTPEVENFLDCVLKTSESRKFALEEGSNFWRAQLGNDWRKEKNGEEEFDVPCPHSQARMKPLHDRAFEGRANPKGIPCLYLSTTKETAMLEARPWIGSYISVGQFKLLKTVEVIDCSRNHASTPFFWEEPPPEKIVEAVWSYIDWAFAKPTTRNDDTADYAATQIIAELFKRAGLGGIAYKSNFGERGYNIALFDIEAADLINCSLSKVDSIDMKYSEQDNPYFVKKYYEKKGDN